MSNLETNAKQLAERYLAFGGKRLSKLDDNIVSTRKWDDEPAEATRFWEEAHRTASRASTHRG